MKKIIDFGTIVILLSNILFSQSISFTSPTMNQDITGGTSSTLIPLTLTYTYQKDILSDRVQYIKLITTDGSEYYDDIGYGIPAGENEMPNEWNLAPDRHHWYLLLYEKYTIGGNVYIINSDTDEIYFNVEHTLQVETNVGGTVNIDYLPKSSGTTTSRGINDRLPVGVGNQEINGNYYVWELIGNDPSEWTIIKQGLSEVS